MIHVAIAAIAGAVGEDLTCIASATIGCS